MTISPTTETDHLIYCAAAAASVADWALDGLEAAGIADDHSTELEAMRDTHGTMKVALRAFDRYSAGRPVQTGIWIEGDGHFYRHLWPATPETFKPGERELFRGHRLRNGPDDDRGMYVLYADDATCSLRVELTEPRPRLAVIR